MMFHSIPQLFAVDPACDRTPALLAQQTHVFWQLLEQAVDATFLWHDQRLVFCNQAAGDLLGYAERADLLQQPFWQLSPTQQPSGSDSKEQALLMMDIAMQRGHHRFAWWFQQADGTALPVEVTLTAVNLDPNTTIFQAVCRRGMTDQQAAQHDMWQGQKLLQALIDNTNACIFIKDYCHQNGNYVLVNKQFEAIFGCDRSEIEGKSDYDFFPKAAADQFYETDLEVLRNRQLVQVEEDVPQADGMHIYLSTKFPLFDDNGEPYALCGISTDITARKRAEEQLLASRQLLRHVIDNIPQAIFWKDRQSVYLGCNRNFAQAAGLAHPGDIIGLTDSDLPWTPEEAEFYRSNDQQVMGSGQAQYHLLESQQQSNGQHIWCDTNKIPFSPFKVLFFGTGNNLKSQFSVLGFQLLVKEKKKL